MKQHKKQPIGVNLRRTLSGVLCAAMLCGVLPQGLSLTGTASAAETELSWSDDDLETLRSYNIMRGDDGGMRPNDTVTRAEFAAMVNRSMGYKEKEAKNPFKDVTSQDWFADDISISHNMGYLGGTSNNTISPRDTLTREQAIVILGRNLMLQPEVGESFNFADSRTFGEWSRGYIDPAVEAGLIDGDRNNDFNPKKAITRGELAGMLVRAIGTPIQSSGVRSLGTVDTNVTITVPGTTLRNTTINGDLYLSAGIGLGDVQLDNVTVNGKIVDAGAGQSEKGDISVVLNNVTADELVIDSMRNQTISVRTSGDTSIPKTSVRTSTVIDDSTSADYGLELVEIDGEEGTSVTLSGNIKEVHNKTPKSSLKVGEGVSEKITVDELATGSTLTLGKDARIKELNLDSGIKVDGSGSIDKLNVSADGATVAQMPDEISVAPGINANVNKEKMDTAAAIEASSRPRLASGYPVLEDLTPTGATGLFETNKPGTVYWAVTALSDGSPSEDDIISPPTYSKTILKSGKIQVKESNKEYTAKISGLTSDGSYYLSAIMTDERDTRSTMKVTAFTTPDNTTPAFAKGYPIEKEISEQDAQISVMTTKGCDLYYALLPKGSTAPRAIDFKAGSISGNLGYGSVKMEKNNPADIFVNDVSLEEQQSYVLYLWLNDFDGAKSSAVKTMNITTQDRTNPVISNLRQTDTKATSSTMSYSLNEQGTLYWAVVATGNETFMSPSSNTTTGVPFLQTQEAKERVVSGVGALKKGSSNVSAAKAGGDIGFNVSGLNAKTTGTSSYDLYYVAKDKAGNWSETVEMMTIYTLDTTKPTVVLNFTSFNEGEDETTKEPLADTDIKLVFSKPVRVLDKDGDGVTQEYPFLDLYQQGRYSELADALRKHVVLYKVPTSGSARKALDELEDPNGYDINYSKARVYLDGTKMVVEFPYDADPTLSGHHLSNGGEYYFELSGIQDTTTNPNAMAKTKLEFMTKQAQVNISAAPGVTDLGDDFKDADGVSLPVDFSFQLNAKATSSAPEGTVYDVILWCDQSLSFDLYRREGTTGRWGSWQKVGTSTSDRGTFRYTISSGAKDPMYQTVAGNLKSNNRYPYDDLKNLEENITYQYAVHVVTKGFSDTRRESWDLNCNMGVSLVAGQYSDLTNLAGGDGSKSNWDRQTRGRITSIGNPSGNSSENTMVASLGSSVVYARQVTLSASAAPVLSGNYPVFTPKDTSVDMRFLLDRVGTVYYVVTPVTPNNNGTFNNPVPPAFITTPSSDPDNNLIPTSGKETMHYAGEKNKKYEEVYLTQPDQDGIVVTTITDPDVKQGNIPPQEGETSPAEKRVTLRGLKSNTWYYVYLMFKSVGGTYSNNAVCYKFKTEAAYPPRLALTTNGTPKPGTVMATVTETSANVYARLFTTANLNKTILSHKFDGSDDKKLNIKFLVDNAPNSVKSYTVLDAMQRTNNGPTLFDSYATDELKSYVYDLVANGGSDNLVASKPSDPLPVEIAMDDSKVIEFLNLGKEMYVCVAVAVNTSDSTKQGFRAIQPVSTIETTPPKVDSGGGMLRIDADNSGVVYDDTTGLPTAESKVKYTLTGTISLNYEGDLYVMYNGAAVPFTQAGQVLVDENGEPILKKGKRQPDAKQVLEVDGTTWGGVLNITFDGGTAFTVNPILEQLIPTDTTKTLIVTVKYDMGTYPYVRKDVEVKKEVDGVTTITTETQWVPPEIPSINGQSLSITTNFVSATGEKVKSVGSVSFSQAKGSLQVQATYKK